MRRNSQGRRAGHRFIETLESRRLLNGGQLDTSFSGDGKAQAIFENELEGARVAIDGDQTVVAGTSGPNSDVVMARFNFDGSLDKSFGTGGIVQIHPDGDSNNSNIALSVAVDSQGRIVVAGTAFSAGLDNSLMVLRFHSDGTLDKSFDHDGIVGVDFGVLQTAQANCLAFQPDGKIVVAGFNRGATSGGVAVVRLNTNGSLDSSFSGDGREELDFGDNAEANAIAIDTSQGASNPRIVVSGDFETGSNDSVTKVVLMRLKSNGSFDTSFDKDGKVAFSLPTDNFNTSTGLLLQSGGKVVFTGFAGAKLDQNEVFIAVRLNSNGSIDNSFGDQGDGIASVGFGGDDQATDVAQGLNGRIFLGGAADSKIAVAVLSSNGILDKTFGTGGKVTTSVSPGVSNSGENDFRSVGLAYMGDRVVVAGANFGGTMNVLRYTDINPTISVSQTVNTINEGGPSESCVLEMNQSLPFPTQGNFSISGTATAPSLFANKAKTVDYTLTNMTIPLAGQIGHPIPPPYVIIPAFSSMQVVTINPVDDTRVEGTETATFTASASSSYSINSHFTSVSFNILDNDGTVVKDTADSYVQDGSSANTNFGTSKQLVVKKAGTGFNRVTYIKFDLSNVSKIDSVQLDLFGLLNDTQDSSITTSVFSVADTSWSETGITFNNAPALGSSALGTVTVVGTKLQVVDLDVTSYVKAQFAAGHKVVSFALKDLSKSSSVVEFNSREAGSQTPVLTVS